MIEYECLICGFKTIRLTELVSHLQQGFKEEKMNCEQLTLTTNYIDLDKERLDN